MSANKPASARSLESDMARVERHRIAAGEYAELPELTDDMLQRGRVRHAGRPIADDPRLQVTIRLPASVLARWKASGPGWQSRMAHVLGNAAPDA